MRPASCKITMLTMGRLIRLIPHFRQATTIGFFAITVLLLTLPAQGADSFTNGSFTTATGITSSTNITGPAVTPTTIPPWNTTTDGIGCVVVNDTYLNVCGSRRSAFSGSAFESDPSNVPGGGNYVMIDGSPDGMNPNSNTAVLYQTVTGLTKGRSYTVTFSQAAAQFANYQSNTTEQWLVSFDAGYPSYPIGTMDPLNPPVGSCNPMIVQYIAGANGCQSQYAPPMTTPGFPGSKFNPTGLPDIQAWANVTMTFLAQATTQLLGFFAGGTPGGAPPIALLGGVSLTAQDGYIKVCKESSTTNPVPATGIYNFTVTGSAFNSSSHPLSVPVGECSGAIPATSPTATITELPTPGVGVSDITTEGYSPPPNSSQLGNALLESFSRENRTATVIVQPAAVGDTSMVTVVTFTNYEAPPAQLELCKIAGTANVAGLPFTFGVTFGALATANNVVEAGPTDQGGYCVLITRTAPVGSSAFVSETVPAGDGTPVITVNGVNTPAFNGEKGVVNFAVAPGINDVSFTNCGVTAAANPCTADPLPGQLNIVNYSLVSQVAMAGTQTQSYMTYQADLLNTGTPILSRVTARLTSLNPSVQVVGQGALSFTSAPANSPAASSNTFTILTDTTAAPAFSKLSWAYYSSRSVPPSTATPSTAPPSTAPPTTTTTGLTIATTSLTNGVVNAAYLQKLVATGGTGPYTWALTSGRLAAGLTLDPLRGVITGILAVGATSQNGLTFQVTDASNPRQKATASFNMTIGPR